MGSLPALVSGYRRVKHASLSEELLMKEDCQHSEWLQMGEDCQHSERLQIGVGLPACGHAKFVVLQTT